MQNWEQQRDVAQSPDPEARTRLSNHAPQRTSRPKNPLAEQTHFASKPKGATGLCRHGSGSGANPIGVARSQQAPVVRRASRRGFTTMADGARSLMLAGRFGDSIG